MKHLPTPSKLQLNEEAVYQSVLFYYKLATVLAFCEMIGKNGLHIFTIGMAFYRSGFIAALMTAFLPVISQIYWLIRIGTENDSYLNWFSLLCGVVLFVYIGRILAVRKVDKITEPFVPE